MKFELVPLPYPKDALEPHLGARTLEVHYERHHRAYVSKLEKAIAGTPAADRSLEDIVRSSEGSVFNNAAQVWNHSFYWFCMKPGGGGEPRRGAVADAIRTTFASTRAFTEAFVKAALDLFGSGYVWLVAASDGTDLRIRQMPNAETPLRSGEHPLLCADVWEHAYYLDYQSDRERYVRAFLAELVHWEFVEANLAAARSAIRGGGHASPAFP